MAPLHPSALLRNLHLARPAIRPSQSLRWPNQPIAQYYAVQSYGGGQGDPKGENPQDQGSNPVTSDAEHPGPPPPDVGEGTGGGPTKKSSQGHGGSNAAASNNSGAGASSSGAAAQPRIHNPEAPDADDHSEEVRRHNEAIANRHEKPQERSQDGKDKVDKEFWKGMSFNRSYVEQRLTHAP